MAAAACRTMASGLVGNNGSDRWGVEVVVERASAEYKSEINRIEISIFHGRVKSRINVIC
eukprot:scaffold630_cov174-Amphora_coffeaeformis.AAC.30